MKKLSRPSRLSTTLRSADLRAVTGGRRAMDAIGTHIADLKLSDLDAEPAPTP